MRTSNHAGPQPDPLPPGKRVDPQVPGHHRHVQVVPALGLYVHVATEDLRKWIKEVEMTWKRLKPKSMDSEHTRTSITDNSFHEVVSGASNYPDIDLHGSSETVEWS